MISAAQVDDEFASHGIASKKEQHLGIEIGYFGCSDRVFWEQNDKLCIRLGAGDQVEDIDLNIVCGRDVWIDYDYNDKQAVMKMKDLCALMRWSPLRPFRAAFMDRKNHIRVLTPELKGWKDITPAGYDELKEQK